MDRCIFDVTETRFFVSVQHNVTGHGVILEITGWRSSAMDAGPGPSDTSLAGGDSFSRELRGTADRRRLGGWQRGAEKMRPSGLGFRASCPISVAQRFRSHPARSRSA